jgi:hypothetical protein
MAVRMDAKDFKNRAGKYWYLSILEMLGVKIDDAGEGSSDQGEWEKL